MEWEAFLDALAACDDDLILEPQQSDLDVARGVEPIYTPLQVAFRDYFQAALADSDSERLKQMCDVLPPGFQRFRVMYALRKLDNPNNPN